MKSQQYGLTIAVSDLKKMVEKKLLKGMRYMRIESVWDESEKRRRQRKTEMIPVKFYNHFILFERNGMYRECFSYWEIYDMLNHSELV